MWYSALSTLDPEGFCPDLICHPYALPHRPVRSHGYQPCPKTGGCAECCSYSCVGYGYMHSAEHWEFRDYFSLWGKGTENELLKAHVEEKIAGNLLSSSSATNQLASWFC